MIPGLLPKGSAMTTTTLAPAVAPEVTTPIKPSEALRLGRLTRPVRLTDGGFQLGDDAACALGAIHAGYGLDYHDNDDRMAWGRVLDRFPTQCPMGCDVSVFLRGIAHLNDEHLWSDDQIADYLRGLGL